VNKDLKSFLKSDVGFQVSQEDEEVFHQAELIQLFPYGISIAPQIERPFLILKSDRAEHVLPVFLNPLEAGVTLTQSNRTIAPLTPHGFARELMKSLDIRPLQLVFVQIKGAHQFVRIYMQGHPRLNSIKMRADEVMSLALEMSIPIFATVAHIQNAKVLNAQLEAYSQDFIRKTLSEQKNQSYIM
jgi:hypothetical protein